MTEIADKVQSLKELGNDCVRNRKYAEAKFKYTLAIKLDPKDHSLYSNRSFVFLKMKLFHSAMEDALMTITLKPDWTKGYFRKAEVEYQTFRFYDAMNSYKLALDHQPNDPDIMEAMRKTTRSLVKDQRADEQIPWLGAGIGIIFGVIIVIADYVFIEKPALTHPLLMALLTISIAMVGFGIAEGFRYFVKCRRKSLLESTIDLLGNEAHEEENSLDIGLKNDTHRRFSKAQARLRF